MLRICQLASLVQYVERNLILVVTSAQDFISCRLPLSINNYVIFSSSWSSMLAVINKDSLRRGGQCGKLHGRPSQLLFALLQWPIDSQLFVDNRDFCIPHLHSTPPSWGSPSELAWRLVRTKTRLVWLHDDIGREARTIGLRKGIFPRLGYTRCCKIIPRILFYVNFVLDKSNSLHYHFRYEAR